MKFPARKAATSLPLLVLSASLMGGCRTQPSPTTQPPTKATPSAATTPKIGVPADDLGRAITLKDPAQRVVVIGPGATESLFAIGAEKAVVGRDSASTYPKRVLKVPVSGDYQGPNVEQVIALHPDLVVVQGETYGATRADDWQSKIGAPVAILAATTVEGVAKGIVKLGAWTGREAAARQIASTFQFAPLPQATGTNTARQTAFFEMSRAPLSTAGQGTLIDDVLRRADYRNVAGSVKGYANYSRESLLAQPPDAYIVTYDGEATDPMKAAAALGQLQRDPVLGKLTCVRKNAIAFLPANWLLRPGPRLVAGLTILRAFHAQHATKAP